MRCVDGAERTVDEILARTWTDGFLVLHRGRIVTEEYRNDLAPDQTHLLMSVSKSITSTAAGVLIGQVMIAIGFLMMIPYHKHVEKSLK